MTLTAASTSASFASPDKSPLRAGERLDADVFHSIRRTMVLRCCKWDPQVEDVSTLAPFPLILAADEWDRLRGIAESLAEETLLAERMLLERTELHKEIGVPSSIARLLRRRRPGTLETPGPRVMRFDFHPTADGWHVSEVNSDVPGGFTEASEFPRLVAPHCPGTRTAGDPGARLADAIAHAAVATAGDKAVVALLSAAGFMEDHQVVANLSRLLKDRGVTPVMTGPDNIRWSPGGSATLAEAPSAAAGAIVRFYQAEWLSRLPTRVAWQAFFDSPLTPVVNPATAILTESKRLPLVWDRLGLSLPTWKRLLPETRDPRDADWRRDEGCVLKGAFCNTGDAVLCYPTLSRKRQLGLTLDVLMHPRQWVAQRRFHPVAISTPVGLIHPCVGVYVIDGAACGIYGRFAHGPVVDYRAMDVAVLVASNGEGRA